jgi:uncharacterized protein YbcI
MQPSSSSPTVEVPPSHDGQPLEQELSDGGGDRQARSPLLQISNAMVRLYKEAFGRGPTKARAQFAGPDLLVVVLEDSLTVTERNLVAMDEHDRLTESRLFFQRALEHRFRAVVEETLGRKTVAFISGIDPRHDVAVELFTLEPPTEAATR